MRRLVLLCLAAVAATNAYNLVIQGIQLSKGLIASGAITCDKVRYLNIDNKEHKIDTFDIFAPTVSPTDETKVVEACNIIYQDIGITTSKKSLNFEIVLEDTSTITFTLTPSLNKVGTRQTIEGEGKYTPLATTPAPTVAPPVGCKKDEDAATTKCIDCKLPDNNDKQECICTDADNSVPDGCKPKVSKAVAPVPAAKAAKKTIPRLQLEVVETTTAAAAPAATVAVESPLPPAIRLRGPGPVRRPPFEDTVDEEAEDQRRVKREDAPPDNTLHVGVAFYILDEAGNPTAVWAAVIEGIILIVLVGLCFYFFFWAPRARSAAAAAADPYKDGPNYSVSYANSSFNQSNQRIDAFQNPPAAAPAAPSRPANSSYLDDYVTDNIGAMSRPAAAPAPAATAANPAVSDFTPRHQRLDSSGLVTVNLS